jgi:predicted transcriptional regulator
MAVSLRVPDDVKKRVDRLAGAQDTTAHAFMLEAIRDKVEAEEARAAFHAEAQRRFARMKKSGKSIPATEVFAYLDARAKGGNPVRPKARKTA